LPLSQAIGITSPLACPQQVWWWEYLWRTDCDWPISMLGWMYTLFFVLLGSAAAFWGGWLEREGPRKAAFVSACCWCGGLLISAIGISYHQLWMLWLGSGVIGGIGLGLGYISPISTLIKWFPDHRGMATGMAIMGFGGGAMIGSPLANRLMGFFSTAGSTGAWETFCVLAVIYFIFMTAGALSYRLPSEGWKPTGYQGQLTKKLVTTGHVDVNTAMRTPQFWLLWMVLCMNVTAGIGVLGMASPLLQEVFGGKLISVNISFSQLDAEQKKLIAGVAAGFTGLLSLFNIIGRFFWSTLSDTIGRKSTYLIFLASGCVLYWSVPALSNGGNLVLFVAVFCLILSMYGGGFATIPAYLADLFGTKMVSAIHGRLLTAWSTAGILGPVLVNYLREYQLSLGTDASRVYDRTMLLLGGLLVIGLICNLLVR
ncbi:MAG: OFA family MFS transporter, partial [Bacteroidota bacterium]